MLPIPLDVYNLRAWILSVMVWVLMVASLVTQEMAVKSRDIEGSTGPHDDRTRIQRMKRILLERRGFVSRKPSSP